MLIHHPSDAAWFSGPRILPGLARITGRHSASDGPGAVRLVSTDAVAPGLALIDAPDVDSVVAANRDLATQLLAAADLWIFVTTANRYADAVPWKLLAEAGRRDVLVAVVLDRVPTGVEEEIRGDLLTLLAAENLGHAPIFVVPEVRLDATRMLPPETVEPISRWLQALAADAEGRRQGALRVSSPLSYAGVVRRRAANAAPRMSRPAPAAAPTAAAAPLSSDGTSKPVPESTGAAGASIPRSTSVASS